MADRGTVPVKKGIGDAAPGPQADVLELLSRPETFGAGVDNVERIDTHISIVFLIRDRAYKLKRAVKLPFLDFSTLDLRHAACLSELTVNRRTAPSLYLGVEAITRDGNGHLSLGGDGSPVDWVVVMRRFDQDGQLDRMAAAGHLTRDHARALAEEVARFHAQAEKRPDWGGAEGLRHVTVTNAQCFAQDTPGLFDPDRVDRLNVATREWLDRLSPLLDARRKDGFVRLCHGDLHLSNICLIDNVPTLFDAIEFNDEFACIDVLYDLAFLLMDLTTRGLPALASQLFNRYFELLDDIEGLPAMPLFLSLRAAIRSHVWGRNARLDGREESRAEALRYLDRAIDYLVPRPPCLFAVGGLSGSGKSKLARSLAPFVGVPPGALVLRSDVIRKRLMGVAPEVRLPPSAYEPEVTRRTYRTLLDDATRVLAGGWCVIADAVFADETERRAVEEVAASLRVPFAGLWLQADAATMRERVERRTGNASDATPEVVDHQQEYRLGPINWNVVDSTGAPEETLASACSALGIDANAYARKER